MPVDMPSLSVTELALLFHGDDLTPGHPTTQLALAICEQVDPADEVKLVYAVYHPAETAGDEEVARFALELPVGEALALTAGFNIWRAQRQERRDHELAAA